MAFDLENAKEVLGRHSTIGAAAAELGLTRMGLRDRFRNRGLHPSTYLAKVPVPEGMRIKTLTTILDDDGEPITRSVHAEIASKKPPAYEPVPEDHHIHGISSYLGPDGSIRGQWIKTRQDEIDREKAFLEAIERATERYRGIEPPASAPRQTDSDLHVVIPIGDPHVGMQSWGPETGANFDLKIAERELFAVVEDLVERSPAAESATILDMGDYFHAQDDKQVTPRSGHKLDVDGRAAKVLEVGLNLKRRLTQCALRRFKRVRMHSVPGNHDPDLARMTMLYLRAVYEREPRVEIPPNFNPFFYWKFGKNLLAAVHGNELKLKDLPGIMAADVPELWGQTTHRYIHSGHVHHDSVTEVHGTLVYTWRTLAPEDSYAHSHGYRSGHSLCAIAYAREGGEVSRVSMDVGTIQRRIAARAA